MFIEMEVYVVNYLHTTDRKQYSVKSLDTCADALLWRISGLVAPFHPPSVR